MPNIQVAEGTTHTISAVEKFQGTPLGSGSVPLVWTKDGDPDGVLTLTPSSDTLSCRAAFGIGLVTGLVVKATARDDASVFATITFDVIFPCDEIDLSSN